MLLALLHDTTVAQETAHWTNWGEVPGALVNPSSAVASAQGLGGVLAIAVIGGDGAIDVTDESVLVWTRHAPPQGVQRFLPVSHQLGLIANADGRLQIFAEGSDNKLWTQWQVTQAGAWSAWTALPSPVSIWSIDQLNVLADRNGSIELLVLDHFNQKIWRLHQVEANANFSSNWDSVAYPPGGNFVSALDATGRIELAAIDSHGNLFVSAEDAPGVAFGAWAASGSHFPAMNAVTALVANQDGRLEVAGTSIYDTWHSWQDSNGIWSVPLWPDFGRPSDAHTPSSSLSFGTPLQMRRGDGRLSVFEWSYIGSLWVRTQAELSGGGWYADKSVAGNTLTCCVWTPWANVRPDGLASGGLFPQLTGGIQKDGRAAIFTVSNGKVFRLTEQVPPEIIPPAPGTTATPARTLEIRNAGSTSSYTNPTCDPAVPQCDTHSDQWVKKTCNNSTWLSGSTKWEWMSVLDPDEQVEKRPVAASGWAYHNAMSDADIWFTHPFGYDFNYSLSLDAQYSSLSQGVQDEIDEVTAEAPYYAQQASTLIHVEMDSEFLPSNMRPGEGDRVAMVGKWIADCGHNNYQTEIHPPLVLASAHATGLAMTDVHIVGRPYLANQNFGGASLIDHLIPELVRAYAPPFPTIAGLDAYPDAAFTTPFYGKQQFDLIFRPPSPASDPSQILLVKYWLVTRPGVTAVFFNPEPGSLGLHVTLDSHSYVPPPLPPRKSINISIGELKGANGSVEEYIPVLDAVTPYLPLPADPLGTIVVNRGINTYQYPTVGTYVPAPADVQPASSVYGKQAETRTDIAWPILGDVVVMWGPVLRVPYHP